MKPIEEMLDRASDEAAMEEVFDTSETSFKRVDIIRKWIFKAGAEWMYKDLTRWHDPKAEQPECNVCVLLKVADQLGNEAIYLGSRKVAYFVTDGGLVFGTDFDETSMPDMNAKVIGWREIHE